MTNFLILKLIIPFLFSSKSYSLKVWIPNTDISNILNWDPKDTPKDCDNIFFQPYTEVITYWDLKDVVITGLSLPATGDLVFQKNVKIQFRNKEKCPVVRDLNYIRHQVKGWLDPDNWKSDFEGQWLPHVERIPCAGEAILFPPQKTFAVQLPSLMVPISKITFDAEVFQGDEWSDFLKTDLGFQLFKGPDDIRSLPWRQDVGCWNNKCTCARSSYTIRDGHYREADPHIYEEAVCLYARPKCQISACYSPIMPEGHCCGVCGALINIEDKTKDGLNISVIKVKVEKELKAFNYKSNLKTYVGRTRDLNVQVVIIAETSYDAIESHTFANLIKTKLIDQKLQARITSRFSGLMFSNYLFNSVTGITFGTLMAILMLFMIIYYIYVIYPKKSSGADNPFMFARFDNTLSEENLEIGIGPVSLESVPQAFDNPMYSGSSDSTNKSSDNMKFQVDKETESTNIKEYKNFFYSELEKTKQLDNFQENLPDNEEEFCELNL